MMPKLTTLLKVLETYNIVINLIENGLGSLLLCF